MGEVTVKLGNAQLTLDDAQADEVRRAMAESAVQTATALASNLGEVSDGFFRSDSARHHREVIRYCAESLEMKLGVLDQLPWAEQEAVDLGLTTEEYARRVRAVIARADGEPPVRVVPDSDEDAS